MDDKSDTLGCIGCIGCLWFFGVISSDTALIIILILVFLA